MNLGAKVLNIFGVEVSDKTAIVIRKFPGYIVYEKRQSPNSVHYVMLWHNWAKILYAYVDNIVTDNEFYLKAELYKRGDIFELLGRNKVYTGQASQGKKDGLGLEYEGTT